MNILNHSRVGKAGAVALLALAALGMSNPSIAAEKEKPGRCYGINNCKGESLCATAKNDCKGLNECKGQGVLVKTPSECKALGGTVTDKE
ncbi:MAG: hypothetical protein EOP92_43855 [Lysobacteraceae bacterium]|nr:MAG: hypothetical protein EOP92_43855 [Xanthomonadaceae bacterium]